VRGSVRRRGSTYTWYLDVPDSVTGKRRQRSKGGYRTKKACQAALNDALAALRAGAFVETSKRTLASYLVDEWLPAMQPPRVRPSTWLSYQRSLERHVIPALGETKLQRLTPAVLTALYRSLLTTGRLNGHGGLSAKSVKNIHGALHVALGDAVRWGYVARNAADATDPPKVATPEMQVWSPAQLRTFLAHARDDRLYAAWMLFATTGMRRGEVAGLRWVDVDLAAGRVSPRKPRVQVNYQVHISEPKTAKGKRSLALDPATVAALKEHRVRQASERLAVGPGWQDSGLVFTWGDGRPLHPERFSRWFDRLARDAGLPKIRLHDVRHSYATAALAAGIPAKIVSERLGHANIAITMDTYSHVLPGLDEFAASTVARLILDDQASDQGAVDKALTTRPRAPKTGKEGSAIPLLRRGAEWGDRRDSNPRPSGPQPDALTN
jgi:integrase